MKLINRLKIFEQKYVFLRWATGAEYGKITYVGEDYVEFNIIDVDTMEYRETVIINSSLILEALYSLKNDDTHIPNQQLCTIKSS